MINTIDKEKCSVKQAYYSPELKILLLKGDVLLASGREIWTPELPFLEEEV